MSWTSVGPKIGHGDILRFESRNRMTIPKSYAVFLTAFINGGHPQEDIVFDIQVLHGGEESCIDGLYGISYPDETFDLQRALFQRFISRLAHVAIPIGFDPFNNQLYLATAGEHEGKVCFSPWEEIANPSVEPQLYVVADSIESFAELIIRENDPRKE